MPYIDLGSVIGPQGPRGPQGVGAQGEPGPNIINNQTQCSLNGILQGNGLVVSPATIDNSPTANSTNLVTSNGVSIALAAKAAMNMISTYENSTTSSRAYGVGQRFCMGNNLYVVTVDIAEGGTISPGTNCTVISAAGLFNPTLITSANDLDNLTGDGFYTWGASSKPNNVPKQNVGFALQISSSTTRKWQLCMLTVSSAPEVWVRIKETNWSAWVQL